MANGELKSELEEAVRRSWRPPDNFAIGSDEYRFRPNCSCRQ